MGYIFAENNSCYWCGKQYDQHKIEDLEWCIKLKELCKKS